MKNPYFSSLTYVYSIYDSFEDSYSLQNYEEMKSSIDKTSKTGDKTLTFK